MAPQHDAATSHPETSAPASTYDGFLFRDNLASKGLVPATDPYHLSPDIIRSSTPVPDPQAEFTTLESLATLYDCDPSIAQDNYYYLRVLNGGNAKQTSLGLFAPPAQLLLTPETWGDPLLTASHGSSVEAASRVGHFGVGSEPFVWEAPPLTGESSFYSFVAQTGSTPPSVKSWLDMATLVTHDLGVGFRNVGYVSSTDGWEAGIGLAIPATFSALNLTLTVTASGWEGCSLGIIASRFTPSGKPIVLDPSPLHDGSVVGLTLPGEPGYEATLSVQCWNQGHTVPAGSTITMLLTCAVPDEDLEEASSRNLLDSAFIASATHDLGVGPQAIAPLGSFTFIAGE